MNSLNLKKENCIGVFDSGVGGIGVLKELRRVLPNENFLYYGDSLNAPYGEKTSEQVFELASRVAEYLLGQRVKAILIACNTATSVAVEALRKKYPEIAIIGMEPALKMAVSEDRKNKTLVMATPMTLHLDKYLSLQHRFENQVEIIALECPGLAKRIEEADFEREDLRVMLKNLLEPYKNQVDNVVLGCTHYPFVKKQIREILGDLPILDGGRGTALQVQRVLKKRNLLNEQTCEGKIIFESSKETPEEISLYKRMYDLYEV